MKYAALLCMLSLLFAANTCKKNEKAESALFDKVWLHSYEEDEGDIMVYRPNTFDFPPSRGRTGFTIEEKGVIKQYEIAPTDGLEEYIGQWEYINKNTVKVKLNENRVQEQHYTFEIISLKDEVLKIKRLPAGNGE